jgi:hypothetical protein
MDPRDRRDVPRNELPQWVHRILRRAALVGSLLNGDIQIEWMSSVDAIKQPPQLWRRGRLRPRLPQRRYVAREVYRVLISCGACSSPTGPKEEAQIAAGNNAA